MADLPLEKADEFANRETPYLMDCYIRGDPEALKVVMDRHNRRLLGTATRFIRCLQMYDAAYEAEDAVDYSWAKICQLIDEGRLTSVQESVVFWRKFAAILRNAILSQLRRYRAARRGDERFRGDWEDRRRVAGSGGDMPPGKGYRYSANCLDAAYARLPPPEDLAVAQLEVESLYLSLEDPVLCRILTMRLEEYTAAEIAEELDLSVRTIERKMDLIRQKYILLSDERRRSR